MTARVLVTGATGIVGRRVVAELARRGISARVASRHGEPPFRFEDRRSWRPVLAGAERLVLIVPEGVELPAGFVSEAAATGIRSVSLLSDKGAEVMRVERLLAAEDQVRAGAPRWSIVRPDWFAQDFDESFFRQPVLDGLVTVPVGEVRQGFVDAADIAEVLVQAVLTDKHDGETLVLTGPEALSFPEALRLIGAACGRPIRFAGDAESFRRGNEAAGVEPERTEREIRDFGRLAALGDAVPTGEVERVTGRPATPFARYVRRAARTGAWAAPADVR